MDADLGDVRCVFRDAGATISPMPWFKFRRADPFDDFRSAVARSFQFLVSDFGFLAAGEAASHRDIEIRFSQATVGVVVGYELGSNPWTYFEIVTPGGRQEFGLHLVLEDRLNTQAPLEQVAAASTIDSKVQVLANLTRDHGRALLSGDASSTDHLQMLRAKFVREQNQQMFGTSIGETPRFATRPTLPQLFDQTTDEDLRCARAYQAVWDYGYSNAEIGEYLGRTADEVQKLLNRWEQSA